MNRKQAVKAALEAVPMPENIQGFWWIVRRPDGGYSQRMTHTEARRYRTLKLIEHARKLQGLHPTLYQGGRWLDYV